MYIYIHTHIFVSWLSLAQNLLKKPWECSGADPNLRCRREFPQARDWMSIFLEKQDDHPLGFRIGYAVCLYSEP